MPYDETAAKADRTTTVGDARARGPVPGSGSPAADLDSIPTTPTTPTTPPAPTTGDQAVDEALRVLDSLAECSVREHVAVFEAVHGALADRLTETQA